MSRGRAVAVNAAVVGDRPTGLGVFALHVIGALAELGERLIVYTSRPDLVVAPGVATRRIVASVQPELGTRGHLTRLLWLQAGLRLRVRHAGAGALLHLMPEAVLGTGLPQVVTVHDLFPLHYPSEYPRLRYYFRYWVPLALRACRAVVTISEASRRDILRFYDVPPMKVHVALCGYDAQRFTPDGGADVAGVDPYALYVGNIMPHKNLVRLVEAFARGGARGPGRLVIRGWGRPLHVGALRERIARLGLESRVDWQPYAPADELPRLYRGARMLLLPSLTEGFGLTALEAMACGTPVITSNTSSLPEVVGDAAILVDPLDTAALADAIARLFGDDHRAKELREHGLARAQAFSWQRTGEAVRTALRAARGEAA